MQALQRWDGFLAQIRDRHAAIIVECDTALVPILQQLTAGGDTGVISRQLSMTRARLHELEAPAMRCVRPSFSKVGGNAGRLSSPVIYMNRWCGTDCFGCSMRMRKQPNHRWFARIAATQCHCR